MNKFKRNYKIKIISLLSSIVLWLYVMATVDPEETKLFENVPVTITNISELNDKNLVIYPKKEITTSVYVTGKLSNIKKISKSDINVYGQINSPIEGNNEVYLKVSTPQRVNYDFKNQVMIVILEKVISEEKDIKIDNINTETIKGNSGKSTTIKSKNTKSKDKK